MSDITKYTFKSTLRVNIKHLYPLQYYVPDEVVSDLKNTNVKRIKVNINDGESFDSSLISGGNHKYFIKINRSIQKNQGLIEGNIDSIVITPDYSKYGMPLPEEFAEIWKYDDKANEYFHQLAPGKQRNLIHIINKIKSPNLRATRSIIIMEHLKTNTGKLDFKLLLAAFRE